MSASNINVKVKTLARESFSVSVPPNIGVSALKEKISEAKNIAPQRQRLIYKGKVLNDSNTLEFYAIKNDDTVHLLVRKSAPQQASAQNGASTTTNSDAPTGNAPQGGTNATSGTFQAGDGVSGMFSSRPFQNVMVSTVSLEGDNSMPEQLGGIVNNLLSGLGLGNLNNMGASSAQVFHASSQSPQPPTTQPQSTASSSSSSSSSNTTASRPGRTAPTTSSSSPNPPPAPQATEQPNQSRRRRNSRVRFTTTARRRSSSVGGAPAGYCPTGFHVPRPGAGRGAVFVRHNTNLNTVRRNLNPLADLVSNARAAQNENSEASRGVNNTAFSGQGTVENAGVVLSQLRQILQNADPLLDQTGRDLQEQKSSEDAQRRNLQTRIVQVGNILRGLGSQMLNMGSTLQQIQLGDDGNSATLAPNPQRGPAAWQVASQWGNFFPQNARQPQSSSSSTSSASSSGAQPPPQPTGGIFRSEMFSFPAATSSNPAAARSTGASSASAGGGGRQPNQQQPPNLPPGVTISSTPPADIASAFASVSPLLNRILQNVEQGTPTQMQFFVPRPGQNQQTGSTGAQPTRPTPQQNTTRTRAAPRRAPQPTRQEQPPPPPPAQPQTTPQRPQTTPQRPQTTSAQPTRPQTTRPTTQPTLPRTLPNTGAPNMVEVLQRLTQQPPANTTTQAPSSSSGSSANPQQQMQQMMSSLGPLVGQMMQQSSGGGDASGSGGAPTLGSMMRGAGLSTTDEEMGILDILLQRIMEHTTMPDMVGIMSGNWGFLVRLRPQIRDCLINDILKGDDSPQSRQDLIEAFSAYLAKTFTEEPVTRAMAPTLKPGNDIALISFRHFKVHLGAIIHALFAEEGSEEYKDADMKELWVEFAGGWIYKMCRCFTNGIESVKVLMQICGTNALSSAPSDFAFMAPMMGNMISNVFLRAYAAYCEKLVLQANTQGHEPWMDYLEPEELKEWTSTIEEDQIIQQNMTKQRPFSDAYTEGTFTVNGPAAKRRRKNTDKASLATGLKRQLERAVRVVNKAETKEDIKENGISEKVIEAVDDELVARYKRQILKDLRKRVEKDPDFKAAKENFPQTREIVLGTAPENSFSSNGVPQAKEEETAVPMEEEKLDLESEKEKSELSMDLD